MKVHDRYIATKATEIAPVIAAMHSDQLLFPPLPLLPQPPPPAPRLGPLLSGNWAGTLAVISSSPCGPIKRPSISFVSSATNSLMLPAP